MKWNLFPDFVWGDTGYLHPWAKNEEKALTNGDWKHLCLLHPTQIPNGPTKKKLPSNFRPSFFRGFFDKVPLVKPAVFFSQGNSFHPAGWKAQKKWQKKVRKHGEKGKTLPHFTNGLQNTKLTTAGCHTTPGLDPLGSELATSTHGRVPVLAARGVEWRCWQIFQREIWSCRLEIVYGWPCDSVLWLFFWYMVYCMKSGFYVEGSGKGLVRVLFAPNQPKATAS